MPSEIRHILFTDPEVGRAVRLYREKTGTGVLASEPTGYALEQGSPGQGMRFSVTVGSGLQTQTLSAAGTELVAALILYCRSQRIPLPANAAKALQRMNGHLCLVLTHGGAVQMPPATALH